MIPEKIAAQLNLTISKYSRLSGGSINQVFLLQCREGDFVLKLNKASLYPGMFSAEAKGLALLRQSNSFGIPEVRGEGIIDDQSYLVLEYLEPGNKKADFWQLFAENLATLHRCSRPSFGLDHDNYIGSLPQYNNARDSAAEFFITQRLEPQFRIARDKGITFSQTDLYMKHLESEIPNEEPALIHGDLWSGNFLCDVKGSPVLIDPAIAYAPREMDLGMMQLFGGFDRHIYKLYDELFPLPEGWKHRVGIWQLYYVLVHVNLFGGGYIDQARQLIKAYY